MPEPQSIHSAGLAAELRGERCQAAPVQSPYLPRFRHLDSCPRTSKGWGEEIEVVNLDYCGKLLKFKAGSRLSMHMHRSKAETFIISSGRILFRYIDTIDASIHEKVMTEGDVIDIPRFLPHQIEALEDSVVTEFSTHHENSDSLRVMPGDSQKPIDTILTPYSAPPIRRTGKLSHYGQWGYGAPLNPYPEDIGRRVCVDLGSHDPRGGHIVGAPKGTIVRVGPVSCAWAIYIKTDSGNDICVSPSSCEFMD